MSASPALSLVPKHMTEAEARLTVEEINDRANEIGRLLLDLKERQGWRALGYDTWTACLQNEFMMARSWLYVLMRAAPVQERMYARGITVSAKAASAAAGFPEDVQENIIETAINRYGPNPTPSQVQRIGTVVTQAVKTGHVEASQGVSSEVDRFGAMDAALNMEDEEARKRQAAYSHRDDPDGKLVTLVIYPGDLARTVDRLRRMVMPDPDWSLLCAAFLAL